MWLQLAICTAIAIGALFFEPTELLKLRLEILTFLSILLGAVLFRLGRGLPQLAVEELSLEEVQRIADAFKVIGERLVWVFWVTVCSISLLIFIEPLHSKFCETWFLRFAFSITVFVVALSLVRVLAVVQGDKDLIWQQAELVKRNAKKRAAKKKIEDLNEVRRSTPHSPSDNYGGIEELNDSGDSGSS